jgi:hypothetical protein
MTIDRRRLLQLVSAAAAIPAAPYIARAQGAYPNRPVRMIVGQAAGSATDIVGRLVAQKFQEHFKQQFIVEARPGAAGNIATDYIVHQPPDGYTLGVINSQNAIMALYAKLTSISKGHRADRACRGRAAGPGGASLGAGQDRSGTHRLRQGQPRQAQHGVGRHRRAAAHRRRAVQIHGRRRHDPCSL